jgi:hypothetical protein
VSATRPLIAVQSLAGTAYGGARLVASGNVTSVNLLALRWT